MARKLKVFSTQMGFVRAVVAAPSRKAALEAWGVRDDLFARGAAEEVTDLDLMKQALAAPGDVLRKPIATDKALISAAETSAGPGKIPAKKKAKPPAKTAPAPSRDALDATETALKAAEKEQRAGLAEIDAEEAALAKKRAAMEDRFDQELDRLRKARDREKAAYGKALRDWEG